MLCLFAPTTPRKSQLRGGERQRGLVGIGDVGIADVPGCKANYFVADPRIYFHKCQAFCVLKCFEYLNRSIDLFVVSGGQAGRGRGKLIDWTTVVIHGPCASSIPESDVFSLRRDGMVCAFSWRNLR